MNLRAAVIADVVGSSDRSDESRRRLDETLTDLFRYLNRKYDTVLSARFDYSLGDEFQAAFKSPGSAVRPVLLMHSWLASRPGPAPIRIRSAIGIGRVAVAPSRRPRRQDGPAFHVARRQTELIHEEGRSIGITCDGSAAIVRVCNEGLDAGCRLLDSVLKGWTRAQWEAAHWRWEGESSKDVAIRLGVAPQNISKRLKSARFAAVDAALRSIETMLGDPELQASIAAAGAEPPDS
jgi:hypothetical protein